MGFCNLKPERGEQGAEERRKVKRRQPGLKPGIQLESECRHQASTAVNRPADENPPADKRELKPEKAAK